MSDATKEDQFEIQKEMLELTIKAGRRLMHDYMHLLDEVPQSNLQKKTFEERGNAWKSIFYPDDGPKNYRTELHSTIMSLELQLERAQKLLKERSIDPTPDLPF